MKKLLTFLLALTLTVPCMFSACGDNDNGNIDGNGGNTENSGNTGGEDDGAQTPGDLPEWDANRLLTVDEILQTYPKSKLKCDEYSLNKYVTPYWTSQVIYNETVCFYEEDGVVQAENLMYKPAKILEVRNYGLDKLYVEGEDYVMTENGIALTENSTIPTTNFDFFYLDEPFDPNAAFKSIQYPDKYVAYNEFQYFTNKQICVTYIRTEEWSGPKQEYSSKLDNFVSKLENKEDVTLLFYGDSIMEGCNASDFRDNEPYMPRFSQLVSKKLSFYYGYADDTKITAYNTAVGGWLSSTGLQNWNSKNGQIVPDLLVLNFGCNDGTHSAPASDVVANMRAMINKAKAANPDCAVILISPITPNKDATTSVSEATVRNFYNEEHETYEAAYNELAEEYEDVVCINMTTLYNWVLERKGFEDIMASNISHPNDFFVRFYAQTILTKLIKDYQ